MNLKTAIDDFLLYIQIEKNYSEHTVISYEYDLNLFNQFLNDHQCSTELTELTKTNVRRFIQYLFSKQHHHPRSIQRKISSLKSFTKYCLREKYLSSDFMTDIESPKADKQLVVYMTLQDLQQLFRSLERDHSRFKRRNEAMFKLLATTGMRRSELVSLTWGQVDLNNQTILIHGKGKKERLLPLHPSLIPLLLAYKETLKPHQTYHSEPLFLNKAGEKLNPRGLHVIFKKALEKAGLPPSRFSLHHMRHTFATLMLQENKENVDLRVLQELLGHESINSTQIYTHVEFQHKKKAIDSFNLFHL